ncbi:MAG: hypothetical protein IJV31_00955 [Clostridia bacterium]|nr:hypothetical protein [Clostridia bacterium]MBQ9657319.1 hypothetical protein [Clostridia bacterium]
MKITKRTINQEMQMSIFDFEGFISDEVILLMRIINRCKAHNEAFEMSKSVEKIYKTITQN